MGLGDVYLLALGNGAHPLQLLHVLLHGTPSTRHAGRPLLPHALLRWRNIRQSGQQYIQQIVQRP